MKLLTVKDASKYLQISEMTVYRYLKSGILKGKKLGGTKMSRWRLSQEDLDKMFEVEK